MMSMGRANPTEALAPRTSANRNTEIMEAPEKPALEIPIQNAARESRHHELISVTMVSGMIKSVHYRLFFSRIGHWNLSILKVNEIHHVSEKNREEACSVIDKRRVGCKPGW